MHLYYEITNCCNLNCDYCYNDVSRRTVMDIEDAKKCLLILKKKSNLSSVTFSGGEPLLRKDLGNLLQYCKETLHIYTKIITNGVYINSQDDVFWQNIDSMTISIHDIEYDEFDILLKHKAKVSFSFQVVVNKRNISYIDKYITISEKYGVPISFIDQRAKGRGNNNNLLSFDDMLILDRLIVAYNQNADHKNYINEIITMGHRLCPYATHDVLESITMHCDGTLSLCTELKDVMIGYAGCVDHDKVRLSMREIADDLKIYHSRYCTNCFLKDLCCGLCPGNINSNIDFSMMCRLRIAKILERLSRRV